MKSVLTLRRLLSVALFASASLYAQTTYTYFDPYSLFPGAGSYTSNNRGHYVFSTRTSSDSHLYLYNAGSLTVIPERGGLTHLTDARLNDNDQVLGRGRDAFGVFHDFIYDVHADSFTVHDFLAYGDTRILGFNSLGQVSVGDLGEPGEVTINRVFDGDMVYLAPGGNPLNTPNNLGHVLFSDGRLWDVRTGGIQDTISLSLSGHAFGNNDWFVYSSTSVLYRANLTPEHIQPFEQVGSWRYRLFAYGINGSGVSVGSLWDYTSTPSRGFVSYGPNALFDLSDLVLGLGGNVVKGASSINDRGEIFALIGDPNGFDYRQVILVPTGLVSVPEPSTFGFLAAVLLGCAGSFRAWRRRQPAPT